MAPKSRRDFRDGPESCREDPGTGDFGSGHPRLGEENRNLKRLLADARELIEVLESQVKSLSSPPFHYGQIIRILPDGERADVFLRGERKQVKIYNDAVDFRKLKMGQRVIMGDSDVILGIDEEEWERTGQEGRVLALLDKDMVRVIFDGEETRICYLADPLRREKIREGDILSVFGSFAFRKLPKSEVEELALEAVPDITYEQIGGQSRAIEDLREAIEFPVLYNKEYKAHGLSPVKGILLYGPPGCGKTLIVKAVANYIAQTMRKKFGDGSIKAFFINVKGPELLTKWVGETERKIREIFAKAREKAEEGCPVVVFFDEFESLFRTRGSGISSDVESTIVPQFLAEIDGVEQLSNVIVIGASNRQDLIDPAVLRPGRFDIKIKVDRPDRDGAREIFGIYLKPDLPWSADSGGNPCPGRAAQKAAGRIDGYSGVVGSLTPQMVADHMIETAVDFVYHDGDPISWIDSSGKQRWHDTRILKANWSDGRSEILSVKDLIVSGAMIKSVVDRTKRSALKRLVKTGRKGISAVDILEAIKFEIEENQDLPNSNDPADWVKILGKHSSDGTKLTSIALLRNNGSGIRPKKVENVPTGRYL